MQAEGTVCPREPLLVSDSLRYQLRRPGVGAHGATPWRRSGPAWKGNDGLTMQPPHRRSDHRGFNPFAASVPNVTVGERAGDSDDTRGTVAAPPPVASDDTWYIAHDIDAGVDHAFMRGAQSAVCMVPLIDTRRSWHPFDPTAPTACPDCAAAHAGPRD